MLLKGLINNSPYIGVFSVCNEEIAIVPKDIHANDEKNIRKALDVEIFKTTLGGSSLIGSLMVLNSHGAVITDFADFEDVGFLKKSYNIFFVEDKINAVGNDILANDRVALIHPEFDSKTAKIIGDVLNVEVVKGEIGGIKTVGSVAVLTKKAMIVHPNVSDDEIKYLQDLFKVPVHVATANFGSLYLGASMIANSKGAYVGDLSTPVETMHIEEVLDL